MNTKTFRSAVHSGRRLRWSGALLVLSLASSLAACTSKDNSIPQLPPPPPALRSVAVAPGTTFLEAGTTQQLAATGQYADGSSAALTSGMTWASSDAAVATVSATGLISALASGAVTITASHTASGLSGTAGLTSRLVVPMAVGALPQAATVGIAQTFVKITGLTAGAYYTVGLAGLDDDVDLEVYSDVSLSAPAQKCVSQAVGVAPESCVAPASAAGQLFLLVDGQWTEEGSGFTVSAAPAVEVPVLAVLAFPADLPYSGSVTTEEVFLRVTGLAPGASYVVRIAQLTDDADLEVYGDRFEFVSLCTSYSSDTVDDFCTAVANAAGELLVEVNGENSSSGAGFTLSVTAAP